MISYAIHNQLIDIFEVTISLTSNFVKMNQEQLNLLLTAMTNLTSQIQQQTAAADAVRTNQQTSAPSNLTLIQNFDHFVSTKGTFRQYRHRFENYLKMKKVETDKEMSKYLLINSIGPEGYKVVCSVAAPDDPAAVGYDDLIGRVEKHLCPKVNTVVEQHRFFNCTQQKKDDCTVCNYIKTENRRLQFWDRMQM